MVALAGAILGGAMLAPFDALWLGAALGGLNGLASGAAGVYAWRRTKGWLAFALDSTWGLALTAAGLLLHVNRLLPTGDYRPELSRRTNHHVYGGGVHLRGGFAWTIGNVTSNVGTSRLDEPASAERRRSFVARHEALHVWQNRIFGPLYPTFYIAWLIAGGVVGTIVWALARGSWWRLVDTAAYYNNPFEYWAYRRDGRWPHPRADARIAWGPRRPKAL